MLKNKEFISTTSKCLKHEVKFQKEFFTDLILFIRFRHRFGNRSGIESGSSSDMGIRAFNPMGGGQNTPCDTKFSEKCPCSHINNTALTVLG